MPVFAPRKPAGWPLASGRYHPSGEDQTALYGDPRAECGSFLGYNLCGRPWRDMRLGKNHAKSSIARHT
jgi:hypothetical protein